MRGVRLIDTNTLKRRRIVVIGASGFIGARVVERLAQSPDLAVTAVIRDPRKAGRLSGLDIEVRRASLDDKPTIYDVLKEHDIVINVAHDFRVSGRRNLAAFRNLVDACVSSGIERLVHTSSIVVYDGWPTADISEESRRGSAGSDYKNAKVAMEEILLEHARKGTLMSLIIQPSIVYGPHSWLWTDQIVERLLSGTIILPYPCNGVCNAVYVDDVADALILASSAVHEPGESFIISGPDQVTWEEFFEFYNQTLDDVDGIRYMEIPPKEFEAFHVLTLFRSILANPVRVAEWIPLRYAMNLLGNILGRAAMERLRSSIMKFKRARRRSIYYPTAAEVALYQAKGRCSIKKACSKLGYEPAFDFRRGANSTAEFVRSEVVRNAS